MQTFMRPTSQLLSERRMHVRIVRLRREARGRNEAAACGGGVSAEGGTTAVNGGAPLRPPTDAPLTDVTLPFAATRRDR